MRPRSWLLLAAFLFLTGICPPIASLLGGTAGLAVAGAVELLSQPPLLGLALVVLAVTAYRRRPVVPPGRA
ncbi:hypothetical protein [Streptomyces luteocolor]|uniref:hypothetical protein n=1 Tax=Streptomyces luteocolor TaxID=285500 RepID=UPI0008538E72|nr:hypothetical protein [Streptomyces luteocolor]